MLYFLLFLFAGLLIGILSSYYERKKRDETFIKDKDFDFMNVYNLRFKAYEIGYEEFKKALTLIAKLLYLEPSQIQYTKKLSSYNTKSIFSIFSDIDKFENIFAKIDEDNLSIYEDENGAIDLTIEELIVLMAKNEDKSSLSI
jgi:hypothetical protein